MSFKQKYGNILGDTTDYVLRATDVLTQRGPVKHVKGYGDLIFWVRSRAYSDLIGYINNTSMAVRGHRLNGSFPVSEQMRRLCEMFDTLERLLVEHVNKAGDTLGAPTQEKKVNSNSYRSWLRDMFQVVLGQLSGAISADKCMHIHELGEYLRRSFGNASSLEFGPGNELMFLFFLCGLFRAGILLATDTVAAALMLFSRYIHLVRRLVKTYGLPMATKPRCCIEDYFLVPYMWGAAQLCLDEPFAPPQSDQPEVLENFRKDYMMLDLIENLPKRGGQLSHNAFQLWCILSVPTWSDVYRGLERSYINHILASVHTVENAIFWELMSFEAASSFEILERPSLAQHYLTDKSTKPEEQASGIEQKDLSVHFAPVRSYVDMELVTEFLNPKNKPEEESSDPEGDDRLAMPHPRRESTSGVSPHVNVSTSSTFSTETQYFRGKSQ